MKNKHFSLKVPKTTTLVLTLGIAMSACAQTTRSGADNDVIMGGRGGDILRGGAGGDLIYGSSTGAAA